MATQQIDTRYQLTPEELAMGAGKAQADAYAARTSAFYTKPPAGEKINPLATPPIKVPRYDNLTAPTAPTAPGFVDSERAKLFATGGIFGNTEAPDKEKIREEVLKNSQATIDAINEAANRLLKTEKEQLAPERLGKARALASRGGLIGSTIYESGQKPNVIEKNKEAEAAIEEDRTAKIAMAMEKINSLVDGETKSRTEVAQGNANAYLDFLKTSQDEARASIKDFAASGVSWDTLATNPDYATELNNLLKYGNFGDINRLEAFFNANKPASDKIQYTTEVIRGDDGNAEMLRYGIDPLTGKVVTQKGSLGISYDDLKKEKKDIREVNGEFFVYDPATESMKKIGGSKIKTGEEKVDQLTLDERKKLYPTLPLSLVGKSEQAVLSDLENGTIPQWYREMKRGDLPATPVISQQEWDAFRKAALETMKAQTQKGTPETTPSWLSAGGTANASSSATGNDELPDWLKGE